MMPYDIDQPETVVDFLLRNDDKCKEWNKYGKNGRQKLIQEIEHDLNTCNTESKLKEQLDKFSRFITKEIALKYSSFSKEELVIADVLIVKARILGFIYEKLYNKKILN